MCKRCERVWVSRCEPWARVQVGVSGNPTVTPWITFGVFGYPCMISQGYPSDNFQKKISEAWGYSTVTVIPNVNIWIWDIPYLNFSWFGYLESILNYSGSSSLWTIVPPFGPGGMTTPSPLLHHSHCPYLNLRHWQNPQTRLAPPKDEPRPSQSATTMPGFTS